MSETMIAQHTSGPWGYDEETLAICRLIVTVEDVPTFKVSPKKEDGSLTDYAIAYVPADYARETQEANARLMAAAPDLLDALKNLRAMIIGEHGASAYENINGELADAAIAKSEGREAVSR